MSFSPIARLRQVPIFAELDSTSLQFLAERTRRRTFPAREPILREGESGGTLYVIVSGAVDLFTYTPEGERVHIATRGAGEVVGELSLIDGKPRMADGVTASPTEVLMLSRDDFIHSMERSPKCALKVMACLADRLRAAGEQLRTQKQHALARVAGLILEMMDSEGLDEPDGAKRIVLQGTDMYYASRIGTVRETFSRKLRDLEDVRAIRRNGREIVVRDARKLRQYCSGWGD